MVDLVNDPAIIREMLMALWRDEARRMKFAEADIERVVFARWLLARDALATDHESGRRIIHGPAGEQAEREGEK